MNQTWENSTKKLLLGPILAHLAQIWTTIPPPKKKVVYRTKLQSFPKNIGKMAQVKKKL